MLTGIDEKKSVNFLQKEQYGWPGSCASAETKARDAGLREASPSQVHGKTKAIYSRKHMFNNMDWLIDVSYRVRR
jgi:hypothetical protein